MGKELVVSAQEQLIKIALLENGKLIEYHQEFPAKKISHGDIYIAQVKKVAPSLNAVFINIGHQKDAFLHYHDLGINIKSALKLYKKIKNQNVKNPSLKLDIHSLEEIQKDGSIHDVLSSNDLIMVQVTKEPISTKGPRLTSEISIPGRYLVLVPFSTKVSCSQKIVDANERQRLKRIMEKIRPEGYGVIVRTVAIGVEIADLQYDLQEAMGKWKKSLENLAQKKIPSKVLGEMGRVSSIIRDYFNADFTKISIDEPEIHQDIKSYIHALQPNKSKIVEFYNDSIPLFEKRDVEKQIKYSFGKHVNFGSGGYLIIEHTEALHVIDINSGTINQKTTNQEQNALTVNLAAAKEVARQLRLRDMGGIIVIDFIDMKLAEHKKQLFDYLNECMQTDRAKHQILPPSKFGLIQITRQRVRQEIEINTKELNPNSDGLVEAPIILIKKIWHKLAFVYSKSSSLRVLQLQVHPFIDAYLNQGFLSLQIKWSWQLKCWIQITPNHSFKYLEFKIISNASELYAESN